MLGTMPKPTKPIRPRRSRTYRLPEDLMDELEALAGEYRRAVTSELEIAIEKHLAEAGRWPPKNAGKAPKKPV